MEVTRDNYYALAGAIVRRAMMDYKFVCHVRRKAPKHNASYYRDELESFFRSEWFEMLCPVDGEILMDMIKASCEKRGKKK